MKKYISKLILSTSLLLITSYSSISAAENSGQWAKIDRYQIGPTTVDVIEHDGWNFPSCPTARHARLVIPNGTDAIAQTRFDLMLSSVILAYANRVGVIIHGSCHPASTDIVTITHLFLQDDLSE